MAASRRILVVDGDAEWRARIAEGLAGPANEVTAFASGEEALRHAQREKPDLVVTAFALPDLSGIGLCRLLREDPALGHLGILMVTSHASEIDRIVAFEAGVDDFLAKPFFARELASRAAAVLRRTAPGREPFDAAEAASHPVVSIHASTGSVTVAGRRLALTPREFQLLAALVRESGRVLTRSRLVALVWGEHSSQTDRVVDAHIKAIRRKLGEAGACVETVRGVGYRYSEQGTRRAS